MNDIDIMLGNTASTLHAPLRQLVTLQDQEPLTDYLTPATKARMEESARRSGLTLGKAIDAAVQEYLQAQEHHQGADTAPQVHAVAPPESLSAHEPRSESPRIAPMSVSEAIAKVLLSDFSLQVTREDAALICGMHAHMEITRQSCLEEIEIERIFDAVCEAAISDGSDSPQRAAAAIQRLRRQGLLERADARGMAAFGTYTLSSMAVKLRDDIMEREALTRRSLRVLMKRVLADLAAIAGAAHAGGPPAHWDELVVDKLRYLVADIIRGIIHRQKGLEADQAEIRRKIEQLLKLDGWQESVAMCEALLETTGNTLEELHKILLEEMGAAQNLLEEISQAALRHGETEAYEQANRLQDQIDSIAAWSRHFRDTWTEYYKKAQEYIRFNLRVDPNRKLLQRLRESIKQYANQPWLLRGLDHVRTRILRDEIALPANRELAKITVLPQRQAEDLDRERARLREEMITAAQQHLREGMLVLSTFLRPFAARLDDDDLFMVVGALHGWLMAHACLQRPVDSVWAVLRDDIEIQELVALSLLEDNDPSPASRKS